MKELIIILCLLIGMKISACSNCNDYYAMSDSLVVWLQNKYDNNAEISEMRNEYVFILLQSQFCSHFLNKIYTQNKEIQRNFYKEIKHPLYDDINKEQCMINVNKSNISQCKKRKIIRFFKKTVE